jgi:hypothetical protein
MMTGEPSERRREFERMLQRHRAAIDREVAEKEKKRDRLNADFAKLRAEMAAARREYHEAVKRGPEAALKVGRAYRDRFGGWPEVDSAKNRRRRPRRKPPGGEPAPVKPRPNPTPLTDGAEAPIE